jgi:hypothetical protein
MTLWKYVAVFADGEEISEEFEADGQEEALLNLALVRSIPEIVRKDGEETTFWQTSQVVRWWLGPVRSSGTPVTGGTKPQSTIMPLSPSSVIGGFNIPRSPRGW